MSKLTLYTSGVFGRGLNNLVEVLGFPIVGSTYKTPALGHARFVVAESDLIAGQRHSVRFVVSNISQEEHIILPKGEELYRWVPPVEYTRPFGTYKKYPVLNQPRHPRHPRYPQYPMRPDRRPPHKRYHRV